MKRIGHVLIISLVIFFSIGSFYIYATAHANGLPRFQITKEAGNDKEIRSIVLTGSLLEGTISEPLTITSTGTKYFSELSFIERFSQQFGSNDSTLNAYRSNYHNFMRGKQNLSSFYEDAQSIAYAGVNYNLTNHGLEHFIFDISILNKENKAESGFQINVPNPGRYGQVLVSDVQKMGQMLDVITINSVIGGMTKSGTTEVHDYQFDLKQQKLLQDETIMTAPEMQGNSSIFLSVSAPTKETAPSNYFIFYKNIQPSNQDKAAGSVNQEFYSFDYRSKKIEKITFPLQKNDSNIPNTFANYSDGSNLYFTNTDAKGLEFLAYNIEKNMVVTKWTIPLPDQGNSSENLVTVKSNRVYIAVVNNQQEGNASPSFLNSDVWVTDLHGKILYKGKITEKGNGNNKSNKDTLQLGSLSFTD